MPARPARTFRPGSLWRRLATIGEAWEAGPRDNPLPGVHGRVCYHPCETQLQPRSSSTARSASMPSNAFSATWRAVENWPLPAGGPRAGKRVLVVGAGPSGLSAAYHLARRGHAVEIREAGPLPGGMLHFGIPAYRLPRAI